MAILQERGRTNLPHDRNPHKLLEREKELGLIVSLLDAGVEGRGNTLLIEGAAGVGKSELLAAAATLALERSFKVLTGRGHRLERDFPYGVVRQLLEAELAGGSRTDPELLLGAAARASSILTGDPRSRFNSGEQTGQEVSYAVLHGLYWFCANLAERAPVLMIVDDAHWADASSNSFLIYMARRIEQLPITLLAAQRQGEGAETLSDELSTDPSVGLMSLQTLSLRAVEELVEDWSGLAPHATFVSACHEATGGNPFLLKELLLTVRERRLPPSAKSAGEIEVMLPANVSRSVTRRLRQLPSDAVELARAIAVLGPGTALMFAAALTGQAVPHAANLTDVLVRTDILKPGPVLDFAHPLVAAAIYDEIPAHRRRILHGSAARLLSVPQGGNDKVASHLLEAEALGDEWAVGVLRASRRGSDR